MALRLLVVGANGMLGRQLVTDARAAGHDVLERDIDSIDITDAPATREVVAADAPQVIVNCAAFTDVDGAEQRESTALAVNGSGAGNLAGAATAIGARIIQLSTDYVFAGDATEPYVESDETGPRSAYGRTKLAGERAVVAAAPNHAIVRTAWLYGAGGKNFVQTMLELGAQRDELRVVDDQVGCPTWTGHLAPVLLELCASSATGVFHAAGGGSCSWFELAREAIAAAGLDCRVDPTTTDEFPRPAPRPAFSVLRSERTDDGVALADWRDGLDGFFAQRTQTTTAGGPR